MNEQNKQAVNKTAFSKTLRLGGYTAILCAAAVVIVIILNLIVGALPSAFTKLDATGSKLFALSEQTEALVKNVTDDVTVYLLAQTGSEDTNVVELIGRYTSLSSHIRTEQIDPVLNPTFVQQYTTESLPENSLVVVSEKRSKVVSFNDIYLYDYKINQDYTYDYSVSFNGEQCLTSAVDYVTTEVLPVIYALTGHGEAALTESFSKGVAAENMDLKQLSLLTLTAVPEDCGALMIYEPTSDISEDETKLISEYLAGGGRLLLLTGFSNAELPNVESLVSAYGLSASEGLVVEGSSTAYLTGYPYCLLPTIRSHAITDPLIEAGSYIAAPLARGIVISSSLAEGVSAIPLLTTTNDAFAKLAGYDLKTYEKEDGDIDGPFNLAVALSAPVSDGECRIVWIGSGALATDNFNAIVSGGNEAFFKNTLGYLTDKESSVSIPAKYYLGEKLVVTESQSNLLMTVFAILLPIAILVIGLVVWSKRRVRL